MKIAKFVSHSILNHRIYGANFIPDAFVVALHELAKLKKFLALFVNGTYIQPGASLLYLILVFSLMCLFVCNYTINKLGSDYMILRICEI